MKYFVSIALLASLFGCAGAQTKLQVAQAKANCYFDLVEPYAVLLSDPELEDAVKGLDVSEALVLAGVAKEKVEEFKAGLKVCKDIK